VVHENLRFEVKSSEAGTLATNTSRCSGMRQPAIVAVRPLAVCS